MTGLNVVEVNIAVDDVCLPSDGDQDNTPSRVPWSDVAHAGESVRSGAKFRADRFGVLAECGHRPHQGLLPGYLGPWQRRVDVPVRGTDRLPAAAGEQLRMPRQFLRRPQPRIGDPGRVKRLGHFVGAASRERVVDDPRQLLMVRDPVGVARKAGVRGQVGSLQDVTAKNKPFAFVLDTDEDGTVTTWNGPYGDMDGCLDPVRRGGS